MLYIATVEAIPLQRSSHFSVEDVEPSRDAVRQWFSLPNVRYIGSHSGCSCGFPSIKSESPIEYFDGLIAETDLREADLLSVGRLLDLLQTLVASTAEAELYPVWDGDEGEPPTGTIEMALASVDPRQFFFHEGFLHVLRR